MAQLGLISLLVLFSMGSWAQYACKEVTIKNETITKSEVQVMCFMKDQSYFISEKCANLDCEFIKRLKGQKVSITKGERPGAILCKALGGIREDIDLSDSKVKIPRCLFPHEKVSISLNLLESWNGGHFTGPSRPLNL